VSKASKLPPEIPRKVTILGKNRVVRCIQNGSRVYYFWHVSRNAYVLGMYDPDKRAWFFQSRYDLKLRFMGKESRHLRCAITDLENAHVKAYNHITRERDKLGKLLGISPSRPPTQRES
jgi:hypothetical protein